MSAPERELWGRFLLTPDGQSRNWLYEVELGEGSFGPDAEPVGIPEYYFRSLKKRVDAASVDKSPLIIAEVKVVGGMAALGQLLTYRHLFVEMTRATDLIGLWLVCGRVDYDVRAVFARFGIRTFVV
jgi:hypothetical protein